MHSNETYTVLRRLVTLINLDWEQNDFGLDYVIDEASSRIDIIDLNYSAAFSDIGFRRQRNRVELVLNDRLVKKIEQQAGCLANLIRFAPKKEIRIIGDNI